MPTRDVLDVIRWREDDDGGHVESFFLKANEPSTADGSGRALWLKWTLLVPRGCPHDAVAEVWAVRFTARGAHVAAKTTVPARDCELARERLAVSIADAHLGPGVARGRAGEGEGAIAWSLEFDYDDQRPMYGFPHGWMYDGGFPKTKLYSSCPAARARGTIEYAGEQWQLDGWPASLGHNWGVTHNPRYHWAQCCLFEGGADAVFEGYSAKIKLGPTLSPWLTGAVLRLDGEQHEFHALKRLYNRSVQVHAGAGVRAWAFDATRDDLKIEWRVSAPDRDFVGLRYVNPDGSLNHCLNSKLASCELVLSRRSNGRWREVRRLRGAHSCAYEVLTQDFDHGVPVLA